MIEDGHVIKIPAQSLVQRSKKGRTINGQLDAIETLPGFLESTYTTGGMK